MSKSGKRFIAVLLILLTIFCAIFAGCSESPDKYTLEEHIERISEKVESRFINNEKSDFYGKYNVTQYKLFPLYNQNDELEYFLVEFEPYGFAFISLNTVKKFAFNQAMYRCEDRYLQDNWQRYRLCIDGQEPEPYEGIQWMAKENDENLNFRYEINEEGKFVEYNHSPYMTANALNQKMYLLIVYNGYIPAIKQGNKFINLVSMEEIEYQGYKYYKELGYDYVKDNIPNLSGNFFAGLGGEL